MTSTYSAIFSFRQIVIRAVVIPTLGLAMTTGISRPSLAATVSIDSLGNLGTVNASGSSSVLTLTVRDLDPLVTASMGGWSVGLAAVPLTGATGSVSITAITYPTSGGIFPSPFPLSAPTTVSNTPFLGAVNINASDSALSGVTVPSTAIGLFQFTLTASANASGSFSLQLVDSLSGPVTDPAELTDTLWNDAEADFTQRAFLIDGNTFVSGTQIGHITAVPEPSTLALLASALFLGMISLRRRFCAC